MSEQDVFVGLGRFYCISFFIVFFYHVNKFLFYYISLRVCMKREELREIYIKILYIYYIQF